MIQIIFKCRHKRWKVSISVPSVIYTSNLFSESKAKPVDVQGFLPFFFLFSTFGRFLRMDDSNRLVDTAVLAWLVYQIKITSIRFYNGTTLSVIKAAVPPSWHSVLLRSNHTTWIQADWTWSWALCDELCNAPNRKKYRGDKKERKVLKKFIEKRTD